MRFGALQAIVSDDGRLTIPAVNLKNYVLELAHSYQITPVKTWSDDWVGNVTRLVDDEVKTDEVEDLIIALKKAHRLTNLEMVQLMTNYLREKERV
ncbi:MAG: hypothetical protein RL748_1521 [Pseudomonadota bacterium]|jgi:hypothetical protein